MTIHIGPLWMGHISRIGLIADTHDATEYARRAKRLFAHHHIRVILHCGDVTRFSILEEFQDFDMYVCLGNADDPGLADQCRDHDIRPPREYWLLEISGKRIFAFHGYGRQVPMYREVCEKCEADYIIKGHTHIREDFHKDHIRVINPGALQDTDIRSCAILCPAEDDLIFYSVETDRVDELQIL